MPPGRLTAKVWLLASMVSNGASDGYGKNQQPFHRAFIPNKGTRIKTRYVKNKKGTSHESLCLLLSFRYADANKILLLLVWFVVFTLRG